MKFDTDTSINDVYPHDDCLINPLLPQASVAASSTSFFSINFNAEKLGSGLNYSTWSSLFVPKDTWEHFLFSIQFLYESVDSVVSDAGKRSLITIIWVIRGPTSFPIHLHVSRIWKWVLFFMIRMTSDSCYTFSGLIHVTFKGYLQVLENHSCFHSRQTKLTV